MQWSEIERRWDQYSTHIHARWRKVTASDMETINGNYDVLLRILQERYGLAHEHAERDINRFLAALDERRDQFASAP